LGSGVGVGVLVGVGVTVGVEVFVGTGVKVAVAVIVGANVAAMLATAVGVGGLLHAASKRNVKTITPPRVMVCRMALSLDLTPGAGLRLFRWHHLHKIARG
jgi:UDP-3-O-[3-hydroxymyristoyl] glucosamine N-acyltransferase